MSDYFLNKIYDSLINRKLPQTKSTFRTLSESYTKIYEQEQMSAVDQTVNKITFGVNEPKLTLVRWTPEQLNLYRLTDKGVPEVEDTIQGETETGVGPGEYAVASVISGITQYPDSKLNNMVSGQSESFDVSWPSKDNIQYSFEVKKMEGGDVRVGRKGAEFGKTFINTVEKVLKTIREEYNVLNEEDKKTINGMIIGKLDQIQEPEKRIKKSKGEEIETKTSQQAREEYAKQIAKRTNWTVDKYVDAVLENMSELPLPLIFGKGESDYVYPSSGKSATRQQVLIMSLSKLVAICESVSKKDVEQDKDTESEQAVKNVFQQVYGTEKSPSFKDYLDQEAYNVDKRITKQKIRITKEEGVFELFFDAIKDSKFGNEIKELQSDTINTKTIEDLFPSTITGLFIVTREGYHYLPQKDISTYVEVSRISQGRPKIRFKRAKEDANV
jgi:hypothetical protein